MSALSRSQTVFEAPATVSVAGRWDEKLFEYFATRFSLWDGDAGKQLANADHPSLQASSALTDAVRAALVGGRPAFVAESDNVALLAIPMTDCRVALGVFATSGRCESPLAIDGDLVFQNAEVRAWISGQTCWQPVHLLRLAAAVQGDCVADRTSGLEQEVESITENLAATYEEISLLYTISQQLRISRTEDELGRLALLRLQDCVPAESLVIQLLAADASDGSGLSFANRSRFITVGPELVEHSRFAELVRQLELHEGQRTFVANPPLTDSENWTFPEIRELVLVPLSENSKQFGWLAAINHVDGGDFGTVEANLISSVAAMLAIHGSNRALYREQAEFVANVVRALVSAIDAKDPYTSGHSDRVARFAVRIALELRCDAKFLNTIYMAGLLHDVGKIGIEDSVLRKAGRLSDSEYEHIKLHPELGCRILADLKQLSEILPAVLHHHERWDGLGYPHGLAGEAIPKMARIMAVADAYDAMTSDRPYRKGLSDEKVDAILRNGAGKQWEAGVLEAFFAAKADILAIADRSRVTADAFDEQWT